MNYDEKHSEESDSRLSDDGQNPLLGHPLSHIQQPDCEGQQRFRQSHLLIVNAVFFCFSLVILTIAISTLLQRPQNYCGKTLTWCKDFDVCSAGLFTDGFISLAPTMDMITDRVETLRFTGHRTKYRGPPTVEVDKAWDQLTKGNLYDLKRVSKF